MTKTIANAFIPELDKTHKGSVRDIYRKADELVMITSDRISCYDCILQEQIPNKGHVLTDITAYWFAQTADIIPNHIIDQPDPNVLVTKQCKAIPLEVIVRGYLTGTLWKSYAQGLRTKCGLSLPDGLVENQELPRPIVTPTTKNHSGHDVDISREEILSKGIASAVLWQEIENKALQLYARGKQIAAERGLILVDTKYEFGLDENDNLILIDEIHTPDSSRYWLTEDGEAKPLQNPTKQFVRDWLRDQEFEGEGTPPHLPPEVIEECSRRYVQLYETLLGRTFEERSVSPHRRIIQNLKDRKTIKGCFALVVAENAIHQKQMERIGAGLRQLGIPFRAVVASATQDIERVFQLASLYNESIEPTVCITISGGNNLLSGIMAARLHWPVIACPYFEDKNDYLINIHSSLQMPSQTPVMTVTDPANATLAAARILSCGTEIEGVF